MAALAVALVAVAGLGGAIQVAVMGTFGERVGDVWRFWSRISGGRVLATNTPASWRYRPGWSWMAASR